MPKKLNAVQFTIPQNNLKISKQLLMLQKNKAVKIKDMIQE